MPRSAMIVLIFGLMFPVHGQSDRSPSGRSLEFVPRQGGPGFVPQVAGSRRRLPTRTVSREPQGDGRGKFGRYGYRPHQPGRRQPASRPMPNSAANPEAGRHQGQPVKPAGVQPARGFLLDARNLRAKEGRVPDGFGQLGLSQIQRERIYGIRALYEKHVEHLEKLIERLEDEELVQCQRILTRNQRLMYRRYQAARD